MDRKRRPFCHERTPPFLLEKLVYCRQVKLLRNFLKKY
nr:MAG TPA: hypothetical protein [Caudoviricetes sp.]